MTFRFLKRASPQNEFLESLEEFLDKHGYKIRASANDNGLALIDPDGTEFLIKNRLDLFVSQQLPRDIDEEALGRYFTQEELQRVKSAQS